MRNQTLMSCWVYICIQPGKTWKYQEISMSEHLAKLFISFVVWKWGDEKQRGVRDKNLLLKKYINLSFFPAIWFWSSTFSWTVNDTKIQFGHWKKDFWYAKKYVNLWRTAFLRSVGKNYLVIQSEAFDYFLYFHNSWTMYRKLITILLIC